MKLFSTILFIAFSVFVHAQTSVVPFRGDTMRFYKQGGNAEFLLENGTRTTTGPLINIGNGKTRFMKPHMINDSLLVIGVDTVTIPCVCRAAVVDTTFRFTLMPASQSVIANTPFILRSVVVNGISPFLWQWYRLSDNANVRNVTKTIRSDTLNESGGLSVSDSFNVVVTDSLSRIITSSQAIITITSTLAFSYGYSSSDPYVDNSTAPTISNIQSVTITHNQDLSAPYPAAAVDKFLVFRELATEPVKNTWFVESANQGTIGDAAWHLPFVVGSYRYYVTRDAAGFTFDYHLPVQLKQ